MMCPGLPWPARQHAHHPCTPPLPGPPGTTYTFHNRANKGWLLRGPKYAVTLLPEDADCDWPEDAGEEDGDAAAAVAAAAEA
jgi:hypothetical protein